MHHAPPTPPQRSRPIPRLRKLTIRLRPEEHAELAEIAAAGRVELDALAGQVLIDYLHRQRKLRGSSR